MIRVILTDNVRDLGARGEIKEVKDGYGHNFLIKRGLAKLATDTILNQQTAESRVKKRRLAKQKEALETSFSKLKENPISFELKADKKTGSVFGSITAKEIREAIGKITERAPDQIIPNTPLKTLGEHTVTASWKIGSEVKALIVVEAKK